MHQRAVASIACGAGRCFSRVLFRRALLPNDAGAAGQHRPGQPERSPIFGSGVADAFAAGCRLIKIGCRRHAVKQGPTQRQARGRPTRNVASIIRILLAIACASPVCAQDGIDAPPVVANAPKVRIEKIKVYSREIAGNLLGTPANRDVTVILPPSYDKQPGRLYPVVYGLHGFSNTGQGWVEKFHVVDAAQAAFARGTPEMILVFPSADNAFGGAFFTNSPTTGNFENFIADELVAYIDSHYRSVPRPEGRGLMGHSMGGYGTARIGMQRPGRFGALYLMSPCCLAPLGTQGLTTKEVAAIAAMKSPNDAVGAAFPIQGPLATAAAWSPNPAKPPLYVDLAVDENGTSRPDVMAARTANAPLAFIDQYIPELRSYRTIGIDVGDKDTIVPAATRMHEVLDSYHIKNKFEIYEGTHISRVSFRFQDVVLPFFGNELSSGDQK